MQNFCVHTQNLCYVNLSVTMVESNMIGRNVKCA